MKIGQLVRRLTKLREVHGNLEVLVEDTLMEGHLSDAHIVLNCDKDNKCIGILIVDREFLEMVGHS